MKLDFEIANDGTIALSTQLTERARRWVDASVAEDGMVRSVSGNQAMFARVLVNEMFASGLLLASHQEVYALTEQIGCR
jgi:hypothetical protein